MLSKTIVLWPMPTVVVTNQSRGSVKAYYLGNSIICGPHGDILCAARSEPTLLVADCLLADYGPTHPLGTSYLEDLRPDLYETLATTKPLAP
jgi:predicted amidohydrolase